MLSCCASCGRKTQDFPIFCYICDDYFCSESCHLAKHKVHYQKFLNMKFIYF